MQSHPQEIRKETDITSKKITVLRFTSSVGQEEQWLCWREFPNKPTEIIFKDIQITTTVLP